MNGIFFFLVTASVCVMIIYSPSAALEAMLAGGEKAVELSVTMVAVYAIWLGLLRLAEDSGIIEKLAKLLRRPIDALFGETGDDAKKYIAMNISANLLGMGGVATPMGVNAARALDSEANGYAMNMLFVLAATSLQLLPTTVVSLRAEAGSAAAGDIILPSLIATAFSTVLGAVLCRIFVRGKR